MSGALNIGLAAARNAGRDPGKEAVVEVPSGRRMTFGELARRVEALASGLLAHPDLSRGDRVAILALNCIEYVEVYLAAGRAGMIAQGLNWRLAAPELSAVLADSTPGVLVVGGELRALADELEHRGASQLRLEFGEGSDGSYEEFLARAPGDVGFPEIEPDEPVLLMYTGGSTGVPKGVVHTHESCLMAMVNNTVAERIVASDRYMLIGQMFHSAAVLALNYLRNGATLVLVSRYETTLALEAIRRERVTAFLGFTTMMSYMLSELDRNGSQYDLSSLRNLQYGGGPYAVEVIDRIVEAFPCGIIQNYGTTEHVGISFLTQEDHVDARNGRNRHRLESGGRAAFATAVRLIAPDGSTVPQDGESQGEIYVRSRANMTGYWGKPDETARITVGDWLGTGDIGVWDRDGYVYTVGRSKDMIISGGENIYAAQVERVIASHPAVLETAVVGTPDAVWGEVVTAYVVRKPEQVVSTQEIQAVVGGRLASYQKPRVVHFIDELPKSPNGKVLKQELRSKA